MDILQFALVFLVLLLGTMLTILGVQVFFILRDLRRSLDKLDNLLSDAQIIADDVEKPLKAAADIGEAMEAGAKMAQAIARVSSPARRLFFKKH